MIGMDHVTFHLFISALSPELTLKQDFTHKHQSLLQHVTQVRVDNSHVGTLGDVHKFHLKSRWAWVGITDPSSPHHTLDSETLVALSVCSRLLVSTPFALSMTPANHIELTATVGAMASKGCRVFSRWVSSLVHGVSW